MLLAWVTQGSPLRLAALAEYHSLETPLRAIGNGISVHRLEASADYIWNESQQARLEVVATGLKWIALFCNSKGIGDDDAKRSLCQRCGPALMASALRGT